MHLRFTYCGVFKMCQISKQTKMHIAYKNINQTLKEIILLAQHALFYNLVSVYM